ncbi:MAG: hypothetical protein F6K30_10165 [Cyanothece sp. SIO2G6]|nr:hypothetical protein [Cyanothece sp. SIO2G6]
MQTYTLNAIQNLQANLYVDVGVDIPNDSEEDYSNYYFQILTFDNKEDPGKLVYGTKTDLLKQYKIQEDKYPLFPGKGVEVNPDFLGRGSGDHSTVRFLLQCRKLSQAMSSTWMSETTPESEWIKKILDSYNIERNSYWLNNDELKSIELDEVEKDLLDMRIQYRKATEMPKNGQGGQNSQVKDLSAFLIQPTHIGYSSIALALLLTGNAYYKNAGTWKRICEPILSTYETIWEYALDISWDTFYAHRVDLSQAGGQQKPPFTKVTLGYPPRPDQYSLDPENIRKWANANEVGGDYPFYPKQDILEWQEQQLKVVAPPFPYLPLSTT